MSEELDIIEVEPAPAPVNLFGAHNPEEVVARAAETATALAKVIEDRRLFQKIGNKPHVLVEGWTLLGSMMGVFPVVTWTRPLAHPNSEVYGWEARVEARTLNGQVVGAAEAECLRAEKQWASRDDYALRSMAQTRATSKALRGPLGFIVHLAGFNATPAEEIVDVPAEQEGADRPRTDAQNRKLRAVLAELEKQPNNRPPKEKDWTAYAHMWTYQEFQKDSSKDLTVVQMGRLIDHLEAFTVPFG